MSSRYFCSVFTFYAAPEDIKKAKKIIKRVIGEAQNVTGKPELQETYGKYHGKKKIYALSFPAVDSGDYGIKMAMEEIVEELKQFDSYFALSQIGEGFNNEAWTTK